MIKKLFALLMLVCFTVSMGVYANEAPDKEEFYFKTVSQVPHMRKVGRIKLKDNQNSITLDFKEVSNSCNNYYISIYNVTDEDEGYILKCVGPITTDKFTFTGLKGETEYKISLSAAINLEDVDGYIYAH